MITRKKIAEFFGKVPAYGDGEYYKKGQLIYLVTGSVALEAYTNAKRKLSDLDLILLNEDPSFFSMMVKDKMKDDNSIKLCEGNMNNNAKGNLYVDLITIHPYGDLIHLNEFYPNFFDQDKLMRYEDNIKFQGIDIPVTCPEFLFVSKLGASRKKDIEDLDQLRNCNLQTKKVAGLLLARKERFESNSHAKKLNALYNKLSNEADRKIKAKNLYGFYKEA